MIKKFRNFILEGFSFVDIIQDLKDEFPTAFEYHDKQGNKHKTNLDELHNKMDGKYKLFEVGVYYCIHTKITDIEGYRKAYPIFLEIIDRLEEKKLYPRNIYFYNEDKRSARQYKKLPNPDDRSIPEIFSSVKFYFCAVPEKDFPKRDFGWRMYDKIMGKDKYRDLEFGSSGDGEDPEEFTN